MADVKRDSLEDLFIKRSIFLKQRYDSIIEEEKKTITGNGMISKGVQLLKEIQLNNEENEIRKKINEPSNTFYNNAGEDSEAEQKKKKKKDSAKYYIVKTAVPNDTIVKEFEV